MPTCNDCGKRKPESDFYLRHQPWGDVIRQPCRECYGAKNRERWANDTVFRERHRAMNEAWKASHPERMAELSAAWYRANRERALKRSVEWQRKNPDRRLATQRKHKYGITKEQMSDLLLRQKGLCPVCLVDLTLVKTNVEHDHKTGKVRGIVCWQCNLILGFADDDPDRLQRAIHYLKAHIKI